MSTLGIPLGIQTSEISSTLNSVIFFIFLMGMYTVIYFGTIYIYFTKNSSVRHPTPAAITLLYLFSIIEIALQWYVTKWQLVNNGNTRQSVFLALFNIPVWLPITSNVLNCLVFVIADGLLIWRCFVVWNHSLRIISLSLFLIVAEFVLFLVEISLNVKYANVIVSPALAARLNAVLATAYFTSFGTTLVTTVLVAYRIYSVSKQKGTSSRRFKHILDIVVQSSIIYALSQFISALAGVIPGSNALTNTRDWAFQDYAPFLNFAIAGISPTIMVARVALLSADATYPATSAHLSGLQFHARSTHPTVDVEAMENVHSVGGNVIPSDEGKAVEDEAQ